MAWLRSFLYIITLAITQSCNCGFYGSHDLGNNFALLEGDRVEDRVIVYCSGKESDCCTGGTYIVPSFDQHYFPDGTFREYVLQAESTEDWIVAKTKLESEEIRYWLIRKNFPFIPDLESSDFEDGEETLELIKKNITGPMTKDQFVQKINELRIQFEID
jgi:hypothetical protein